MNFDRLRDFLNDPGARIGKYEVVRKVGEGGMGVVYEAFDPDLKRSVALKVLKQQDADRLRREAVAAAKLRHPNIVTIHEVGPDFIAMEFVAGRSPAVLSRAVLETVARAVAAAHAQGVVHRDLKPGNILIDGDGRVVLTDFGLATEESGGTPGYRAPEGVSGPAVDVWALCVMAREAGLGDPDVSTAAEFADWIRPRSRRPLLLALLATAVAALVAGWMLRPGPADPLRRLSLAEEDLTRALQKDPDNVDLLVRRARVRLDRTDYNRNRGFNPLPDYAGAEEDLTRALRRTPTSEELLFRRGIVRTQRAVYKVKYGIDPLGDCAAAEQDLILATGIPGGRTWLGNVRFHRGAWLQKTGGNPGPDFEAAEKDLTPADTPERLMRRGRVRAFQNRFEEAEQDFIEAVRLRPESVWAWTWRGNARLVAGDWTGAEAHLTRAIAVDREFSEAWEQRGHARFEQGDFAAAASDFREAVRLNPSVEALVAAQLQEALRH